MTKTCQKNIGKAIKKTLKMINDFTKDSKKALEKDDDDQVKSVYIETMRLNKNYNLEIDLTPIGVNVCELIYYITDNKGMAIDQVTHGHVDFYFDYTAKMTKDLEYLLNMYC